MVDNDLKTIPIAREDASQIQTINETGNVHLLRRVMVILRIVSGRPAGMTIAEIAATSSMPRTTVQRLVEAMQVEGLIFSSPRSKLYRLGFALRQLADAADWQLSAVARPFLEELASSLNETVALALFNNDHAVYLDVVVGTRTLQAFVPLGTPMPLHSLASGKALLALLDGRSIQRLQKVLTLQRFTPHTITEWGHLHEELAAIRREGYAKDMGENAEEIGAFAIAFTGPFGELGAVSIAGPVERIKQRQAEILEGLFQIRSQLQDAFAVNNR